MISSPVTGASTRDRTPGIGVTPFSGVSPTADVQIAWRTAVNGADVYLTSAADLPLGVETIVSPVTDLTTSTWFFRARAGNADTNSWGPWTAWQWVVVRPVPGFAHIYMDYNVGVQNIDPIPKTYLYLDFNVGLVFNQQEDGYAYLDFNVGLEPKPKLAAEYVNLNIVPRFGKYRRAAYLDFNVDDTAPQVPHIWWIRPTSGKEGLAFNIYGQGFGVSQGEYDATVKLGDLVCPVTHWEYVPAGSGTPYINQITGQTNVPHEWIVALVPDGAESGLVKIVLEEP